MTKFVKYYFIFGAFLLSFPFLLSQNLPFAYWDWLMVPYYQLQGDAVTPSKVPQNLFFSLFLDEVQFRPLAAFLTNLQYIILKGEFWAWYLIRWAIFGLTIYLIYKIIIEITKSEKAALLSAVFFMLHPMPLVKDVLSQDAYVVIFASLTIFYLVSSTGENKFNIDNFNKVQYSIFLFLFALTSFSKEIALAFTLPLTVLILFNNRKNFSFISIAKTSPFLTILGFSIFRILGVNHPTSRLNESNTLDFNAIRWGINRIFDILFPNSPFFILSAIILAILVFGLILCIIRGKYLAFFFLYGITLCLSLAIIVLTYPCPKYLPTPVLCLSLLIGFASAELFKQFYKSSIILIILFCLIYPAFTLPNIYSQWFAMQQSLYEMSDIIQFMYQKNTEGYALALTGLTKGEDIPWEKGATFSEFFKNASNHLYKHKNTEFFVFSQDGIPPRPFVLLTGFLPDEIGKGKLAEFGIDSLAGFTSAYEFERNHFGVFAKVTESLKKFEQFIGNTHLPTIDCASPMPSTFGNDIVNPDFSEGNRLTSGSHLLYLVDPAKFDLPASSELEITLLIPNRKFGAFGR
ncbi:hypothetical protein [Lusitaniella coriacea]|uniref:hypothetical protein n=1 Tax=Lusitaniella coriacea TaxID=1983105 RepID=UPI003CE833FB